MTKLYMIFMLLLSIVFKCYNGLNLTNFTTQDASELLNKNVKRETIDVVQAVAAKCMPEKQVVKLGPPPDLNSFYWPSCIRIERCGGCCTQNELLSCQPVEKVIINYQVGIREVELGIHHSRDHYSQKKVIVPVEKHIRCKCDCRIKKEDCPRLQEYKKESCACVCTNRDEKAKCEDDASNKTWDPHSCTCNCLEEKECQSGYIFNKHSCSCEAQRTRIRYQPGRNPFLEPTLDQRQIIT